MVKEDKWTPGKPRWTDKERTRILQVMSDDTVYNCVYGLLDAMCVKEAELVLRVLRGPEPPDVKNQTIVDTTARVKVIDQLKGYLHNWKFQSEKLKKQANNKEESKDGKKEKR